MIKGEDLIISDVTGKQYYPSEVVRILNVYQVIAYLRNGIELLDIYPSQNHETGKPLLVYIFNREKSKVAYDLWCKKELN